MRLKICSSLALLALAASAARGDKNRIVIESYVGPRPHWAVRPVTQLRISLEKKRFTGNPSELRKMLGEQAAMLGAEPKFNVRGFKRQVQLGLQRVVDEDYDTAIHVLVEALQNVDNNPLALCQNNQLRETKLDALIYLARAYHHRNRMTERDAVMASVIRSYPTRQITATQYGPKAEEIYNAVKVSASNAGGKSLLIVEVDGEPGAMVCVDDMILGEGRPAMARVAPGEHRLLIVDRAGASRQYNIRTAADSPTSIVVPWDVHSVLVTDDYVGFQFAATEDRKHEGFRARKFAGVHTSAVMVAVVSARLERRKVVVSGSLHAVQGGYEVKRGEVVLDGKRDNEKLDQLAAYLGDQVRGADVHELDVDRDPDTWQRPVVARGVFDPNQLFPDDDGGRTPAREPRAAPRSEPPARSTPLVPALVIAGAGALTGSGVLLYAGEVEGDGSTGMRVGWVGLAIAATAMLTTGFIYRERRRRSAPVVSLVPIQGGTFGQVRWSF